MNKKGFTLVELIGVLAIIGVLSLIAIPTILTMVKEGKEEAYNNQISSIKLALQNWKDKNPLLLPKEGEVIYLTISQLKSEQYLDGDLKNPATGKMIPNDMLVTITNNQGYQYNVIEESGTETNLYEGVIPYISFSNGNVIFINKGDIYNLPKVILNKVDGTQEELNLTPIISGSGDSVDTSNAGIYQVKYETVVDNIKIASIQNVIVRSDSVVAYQENILNGAYPVIKGGLIPVIISDDGTVTYANINNKWYSYNEKKWANAIILVDSPSKTYNVNDVILESDIESYFVWIPKYSYELWDLGLYSNYIEGTPEISRAREINIRFGTKNTVDTNTRECTTPLISGASGNCQIGDYMTHPAFITMGVNGLWVGKFEVGYNQNSNTSLPITTPSGWTEGGAKVSPSGDDLNNAHNKIIVKPDVYSWRKISIASAFKTCYDYNRTLDSHMMKNTEWGAVTYLYHSKYGKEMSSPKYTGNYITGYYDSSRYNNNIGYGASTTGNIYGVYDMNGVSIAEVVAYAKNADELGARPSITNVYSDFFTNTSWNKYYDEYLASKNTDFNMRILGDATGELGPFYEGSTKLSSWNAKAEYLQYYIPAFYRDFNSGILSFDSTYGAGWDNVSFHLVLAPK